MNIPRKITLERKRNRRKLKYLYAWQLHFPEGVWNSEIEMGLGKSKLFKYFGTSVGHNSTNSEQVVSFQRDTGSLKMPDFNHVFGNLLDSSRKMICTSSSPGGYEIFDYETFEIMAATQQEFRSGLNTAVDYYTLWSEEWDVPRNQVKSAFLFAAYQPENTTIEKIKDAVWRLIVKRPNVDYMDEITDL